MLLLPFFDVSFLTPDGPGFGEGGDGVGTGGEGGKVISESDSEPWTVTILSGSENSNGDWGLQWNSVTT